MGTVTNQKPMSGQLRGQDLWFKEKMPVPKEYILEVCSTWWMGKENLRLESHYVRIR